MKRLNFHTGAEQELLLADSITLKLNPYWGIGSQWKLSGFFQTFATLHSVIPCMMRQFDDTSRQFFHMQFCMWIVLMMCWWWQ